MSKYDLLRATIRVLEVAEQEAQNPRMPLTNKEKQEAYRARQSMLGQTEVRGIYLPPDLHAAIKEEARKLLEKWQAAQGKRKA